MLRLLTPGTKTYETILLECVKSVLYKPKNVDFMNYSFMTQ